MPSRISIDRRIIGWFLAGILTAAFVQFAQVRAIGGGIEGLLSVGDTSPMRPFIESELGPVATVSGSGHDGQTAYIVARDPLARTDTSDLLDDAGFRYRRILYPLLGGLGGIGPGTLTVWGLAIAAAFGLGLSAAAVADILTRNGWDHRWTAAVLVTPGLWLSLQLLTVDSVATGLALVGLSAWLRTSHRWAIASFLAAALVKEQMLLIPWAIGAFELARGDRRLGLTAAAVPTIGLVAWGGAVTGLVGGGFTARGNLGLPFVGVVRAATVWPSTPVSDVVMIAMMVVLIAIAIVIAWHLRDNAIGWALAPWPVLALLSSNWVWELGNNVARVFAILGPLAALGAAAIAHSRRADVLNADPR